MPMGNMRQGMKKYVETIGRPNCAKNNQNTCRYGSDGCAVGDVILG